MEASSAGEDCLGDVLNQQVLRLSRPFTSVDNVSGCLLTSYGPLGRAGVKGVFYCCNPLLGILFYHGGPCALVYVSGIEPSDSDRGRE